MGLFQLRAEGNPSDASAEVNFLPATAQLKGHAMIPSSSLCREQETFQRHRAATTSLDNVRIVAERAAVAWALEAAAADKREARHKRTLAIRATIADQKILSRQQSDRWFSENPDRGFVAPAVSNDS